MLNDLVRPVSLTISYSFVPTAIDGSSVIYLLTTQIEQLESEESVRLHPIINIYCRNQNLTFPDLVQSTNLFVSTSTVPKGAEGSFPTY